MNKSKTAKEQTSQFGTIEQQLLAKASSLLEVLKGQSTTNSTLLAQILGVAKSLREETGENILSKIS